MFRYTVFLSVFMLLTACSGNNIQDSSISSDGKYVGQYKDGKRHGQGTLTRQLNNYKYVGQFKDGKRHGQGTENKAYGKYVGQYKDGKRHGQGTYINNNMSTHLWTYVGQFENGEYNGQGTLVFANGKKYEGPFRDGSNNGQMGTLTWPDGRKYVGRVMYSKADGQGVLTSANGTQRSGMWYEGKPVNAGSLAAIKRSEKSNKERAAERQEDRRRADKRADRRRASKVAKERALRREVDAKKRALFNNYARSPIKLDSTPLPPSSAEPAYIPRTKSKPKVASSNSCANCGSFEYPKFKPVPPKRKSSRRDPGYVPIPSYIPMPSSKDTTSVYSKPRTAKTFIPCEESFTDKEEIARCYGQR